MGTDEGGGAGMASNETDYCDTLNAAWAAWDGVE